MERKKRYLNTIFIDLTFELPLEWMNPRFPFLKIRKKRLSRVAKFIFQRKKRGNTEVTPRESRERRDR